MTRHAYLETRAVSLLNIYRIVVIGYICVNVNSFYSMMGLRRWKIGNRGFDVGYQTLGEERRASPSSPTGSQATPCCSVYLNKLGEYLESSLVRES